MFPFLSVNLKCSRQRFIRRLTQISLLAAAAASMLHVLPLAVRRMLVSLYAGKH